MKQVCWQNRNSETQNSDPYYFCSVARNMCKDIFNMNPSSTVSPPLVNNNQRIERQNRRIVSSTERIVPTLPRFKNTLDNKYFQITTSTSTPAPNDDGMFSF